MIRRTVMLATSFLLFTALAVAGNKVERRHSDISVNVDVGPSGNVLSVETESTQITNTQPPTNTSTVMPTQEQDYEEVETSTPTLTPSSSKLDYYTYPGALIESKTEKTLSATSSENPKTVTDWYEKKIRENGYNVKSFVRTNTNDVVKNVISAAKSGEQIKVEITNKGTGSTIKVDFYPN